MHDARGKYASKWLCLFGWIAGSLVDWLDGWMYCIDQNLKNRISLLAVQRSLIIGCCLSPWDSKFNFFS